MYVQYVSMYLCIYVSMCVCVLICMFIYQVNIGTAAGCTTLPLKVMLNL